MTDPSSTKPASANARRLTLLAAGVLFLLAALGAGLALLLPWRGQVEAPIPATSTALKPSTVATAPASLPETPALVATVTPSPAPKPRGVGSMRRPRPVQDPDRTRVTVLMYHEVKPNPDNDNAISPEMFERQMSWLAENGYHALSMEQYMGLVDAGRPVPDKPVLITFDDGYMNLCFYAAPILKKHHFTATFFVVKDWSLDLKHQTWMHPRQLQDLVKQGFDVQSHTSSHVWLEAHGGEDYAAVKRRFWNETFGARQWIESVTHKPVYAIAYPSGIRDGLTVRLVRESGYLLGFTTDPGRNGFGGQSDYEFRRYDAGAGYRPFSAFTSIFRKSPSRSSHRRSRS